MLIYLYLIILLLITFGLLNDFQMKSAVKSFSIRTEKSGEKLLFQMSNLFGNFNEKIILPEYKFYTQLLIEILSHQKKFGLKIRPILKTIRENLISDLKFEKQINSEILKAIIQFIFISFITWFFILTAQSLVEIKVDHRLYFAIFGLQIFGLITYLVSAYYLKQKIFKPISEALMEMITFKCLYEAGVSINQIALQTDHLPKTFYTHKSFTSLVEYLTESIQRLEKMGQSPKEDLEYIIENLFSEMTNKLNLFQKSLGISKFLHLALIYLPAYFLFLAAIYKFFMEQ